jgi:hypothetical protein
MRIRISRSFGPVPGRGSGLCPRLHLITRDLPAFQLLYDDRLSKLPNVQRLTSTPVMKRLIQARSLPL